MNLNQVPLYNTMTFDNVFEDADSFVELLKYSGIPLLIKEENAQVLYYLLYAKYGNSPIANTDVNQFKYKICSIVYQYGPSSE